MKRGSWTPTTTKAGSSCGPPECTYWIPCNDDDADPHKQGHACLRRPPQLEDRVWRLSGLHAHAQRPKSRLARVVSNVEIEPEAGAEIVVHSAFVACEVRKNETRLWVGRCRHVLLREPDGLRIKQKKIMLANNDTVMSNLTFII